MEKEFVNYTIALELKQLGFDEPCFMFYEQGTKDKYLQQGVDDDYWVDYSEPRDWNSIPNKPWKPFCQCISAPLYQQAFRWFREKYQMIFCYEPCLKKDLTYIFFIYIETTGEKVFVVESKYDEEAESACLDKLIEIVKSK
jgi:hypothetical protein